MKEWIEEIQIRVECSDAELPAVIAALNGQLGQHLLGHNNQTITRLAEHHHGGNYLLPQQHVRFLPPPE